MIPALLVEAFADGPCRGNGAVVLRLDEPLSDGWLQQLARSFNQSETAFLWWDGDGWRLRWFTPECEVPLCGHATLAACLALGHWGLLRPGDDTAFQTRSGALGARLETSQALAARIELPSPGLEPAPCPNELRILLQRELDAEPVSFWRSSLGYAVALVGSHCQLQTMVPLADQLQDSERSGLVVMQPVPSPDATQVVLGLKVDYQLRFFAPGLGIAEDPVTGSAHALVAPYWLDCLGVRQVVGWQCSPRPGGMVCESTSHGRMALTGQGHVLWDGQLSMGATVPEEALSAWLGL